MAMYSFFLVQEREKSERLLLNIMPKEIADKLKQNDNLIAIENQSMSVLMADIVSFTKLANSISAEKLVDFLNKMFSDFDEEVEKTNKDFVFFNVDEFGTITESVFTNDYNRYKNNYDKLLSIEKARNIDINI